MKQKIFFLCHSTLDKPTVRPIYKSIGEDKCWFDEGELRLGVNMLKQVDKGIADSRIFVLFWSRNVVSSQSGWIEEEISQARIRAIRDKGYRFMVVTLDDTEVPIPLATRYYLHAHLKPEAERKKYICQQLDYLSKDLSTTESILGKPLLRESFQNREKMLDKLENFTTQSLHNGILVQGLDGMGKTSLIKIAMSKLWPDLHSIWVDLNVTAVPIQILSALARPLSVSVDSNLASLNPIETWKHSLLPELDQSPNTMLVLDNYPTTTNNRPIAFPDVTRNLLAEIVGDLIRLSKQDNPNLLVLVSGPPLIRDAILARMDKLQVPSLLHKDMTRALKFHLTSCAPELRLEHSKLEKIATLLRGYPLLLTLAAQRIADVGPDVFLADSQSFSRVVISLAHDLMARLSFSDAEKDLLVLLAIARRPLFSFQLASIPPENSKSISGLSQKLVLDMTQEGIALHGLLREYVLESMASTEERRNGHKRLGKFYEEEWQKSAPQSAQSASYGSLAFYHCASSGDLTKAHQIAIEYEVEAGVAVVECYHRGDYEAALKFAEGIKQIRPKDISPELLYYYALSLFRTRKSEEGLEVMKSLEGKMKNQSQYWHGLGVILRGLRKSDEALQAFRKAIVASGGRNATAYASAANVLCDMGKPREAVPFVKKALRIAPSKSHIIAIAARVLEEQGDTQQALKVVERAIKLRPHDPRLHHRAGMILKRLGHWNQAKGHLEQAVSKEKYGFSMTALADVYLQLGKVAEAEKVLSRYPGNKYRDPSYLSTMANILRTKGQFEESDKLYRKAIKLEPENSVHYGGIAHLKKEEAEHAIKARNLELARTLVEEASKFLEEAGSCSPTDDYVPLLEIDNSLKDLRKRLGMN